MSEGDAYEISVLSTTGKGILVKERNATTFSLRKDWEKRKQKVMYVCVCACVRVCVCVCL